MLQLITTKIVNVSKCACNADLCNTNATWNPQSKSEQPHFNDSSSSSSSLDGIVAAGLIMVLIGLCIAANKVISYKETKNPYASLPEPPCTCLTGIPSEMDIADIELLQVVNKGNFATVWQGKYRGAQVAVKVFPDACKQKFTAEKKIFELPLMEHASIVHFLGSASSGSEWLIGLEFAQYGSLHSFLHTHTSSWEPSLTLCQSLSQGLSYLHSDLHRHDVHKPPVAHRDLSSANVLVKADGTCALSDFGCSTILRSCSGHHRQSFNPRKREVATLRYMSPEILEGSVNLNSDWCLQGDVYALGLVMWEIWMRCSDLFGGEMVPQHLLPYEQELGPRVTVESLVQYVFYMDKRPAIPKLWGVQPQAPALQELLTSCWDGDADARLSSQCVVERLASFQRHLG